ncbi:MAG: hypothetical protein ACLT4K_13475 [Catenibacterium sp.]
MDWLRSYSGEFDSIEELQKIVDKLNVKMNTNICQGTGMSPCLLFIKEKEYLTPLPDRTVLDGYLSPHKVKVSSQHDLSISMVLSIPLIGSISTNM